MMDKKVDFKIMPTNLKSTLDKLTVTCHATGKQVPKFVNAATLVEVKLGKSKEWVPHDSTWVKKLNFMNMKKLTPEEEYKIREIFEEKDFTG